MQAILFYGWETLVLLVSMAKRIEVKLTEFLRMITWRRAKQLGSGSWETPGAGGIREEAGTQSDRIYIER